MRHAAKRHLLDTIGVMIAGAQGELTDQAERVLASVRPEGGVAVPGRRRRADILDAAFLSGTAGHGIELDDGHRQGSVHPAVCVIPAALYAAHGRGISGTRLLEAIVCGYEAMIGIAVISHPHLRRRGFHPTSAAGVFGAAIAASIVLGLNEQETANAIGLAASGAAGLFAFINGGTDVKRLHAGHAAREGLQAALLAQAGVAGPPNVIEGRDGFMQAFPGLDREALAAFALPPLKDWELLDCYIKPYACCRHLQTALEVLIDILNEEGVAEEDIAKVSVKTYRISAAHAETGWSEFASAQLSFPYILALGMRYRKVKVAHFDADVRESPAIERLCALVQIEADDELDKLYPEFRPSRVTVETRDGRKFSRLGMESRGSRQFPVDDARLGEKFVELAGPSLGDGTVNELLAQLWKVEDASDVTGLIEAAALHN
ncbi:immune-responsive protein 1 [Sphingobium fuliginis]|uniref:Immune-responsive protein 1 n=1 Tax=Sphingobium fuliginis (strain ATCC 27551) TaxID=336203 RepID=A0A292ZH62_SPHSA|nr:immune-responsive protein 1 [Sphingobium fuliginis]